MGGGAWPFLVGGVICLVNSDNGRDLDLLTSEHKRLPGEGLVLGGSLLSFTLGWILDDLSKLLRETIKVYLKEVRQ